VGVFSVCRTLKKNSHAFFSLPPGQEREQPARPHTSHTQPQSLYTNTAVTPPPPQPRSATSPRAHTPCAFPTSFFASLVRKPPLRPGCPGLGLHRQAGRPGGVRLHGDEVGDLGEGRRVRCEARERERERQRERESRGSRLAAAGSTAVFFFKEGFAPGPHNLRRPPRARSRTRPGRAWVRPTPCRRPGPVHTLPLAFPPLSPISPCPLTFSTAPRSAASFRRRTVCSRLRRPRDEMTDRWSSRTPARPRRRVMNRWRMVGGGAAMFLFLFFLLPAVRAVKGEQGASERARAGCSLSFQRGRPGPLSHTPLSPCPPRPRPSWPWSASLSCCARKRCVEGREKEAPHAPAHVFFLLAFSLSLTTRHIFLHRHRPPRLQVVVVDRLLR
jgi:hypothetical protein